MNLIIILNRRNLKHSKGYVSEALK
ncbi:hypothetical protein QBC30_001537 [Citrobacter freundii]